MSLLFELAAQEDLNVGTSTELVTTADGGGLVGTQIGIHTFAVGQLARTITWNPSSIAAGSYESVSIAIPGAVVNDFVDVSLNVILTDTMQITGHVSADDTVKAVLYNPTASPINLGSGTLSVLVYKARS